MTERSCSDLNVPSSTTLKHSTHYSTSVPKLCTRSTYTCRGTDAPLCCDLRSYSTRCSGSDSVVYAAFMRLNRSAASGWSVATHVVSAWAQEEGEELMTHCRVHVRVVLQRLFPERRFQGFSCLSVNKDGCVRVRRRGLSACATSKGLSA